MQVRFHWLQGRIAHGLGKSNEAVEILRLVREDYDRDGIPDLVFVKTSNTGTGTVEVHVAS